jgi:flagellar hook-length control protein FliK
MMKIVLPNNGKLNAGSIIPGAGKGTVQSVASGAEDASQGGDLLPFPVIFAKMVDKAVQLKEAASSAAGQNANSGENVASGAVMAGEHKMPGCLLQIKDLPSGQEDEVVTLELDLQALLQALQNEEAAGENPTGFKEAADALSAYLAALISALQKQGGANESALDTGAVAAGGKEITDVMQKGAKGSFSLIDQLTSLLENDAIAGTEKGNKILLTLPQELMQGFVINKNGQPHFAMNGTGNGPAASTASEDMKNAVAGQPLPAVTDGQDAEGMTFQLVRLNAHAASSSPQGALLAAAAVLQKANPSTPVTPDTDASGVDIEAPLPAAPSPQGIQVKSAGERSGRELLLNPNATGAGDKGVTPAGTDAKQGLFPANAKAGEQDMISARKAGEAGEKASLLREDSGKGTQIVAGKDSAQWVPYAGATSPQVPLGSEAPLKGVFIPMDRLISEAGAVLEKGAGKVQMTLQPPSLGTINMEVVVQNNRVELVLTADHADVQQILQANSDQLKNALNNQGFQVDQMSVLLKRENFGFNLGGNPLWQNGAGQQQSHGNGSSASPSLPEPEIVTPRDYGPGTISIFA